MAPRRVLAAGAVSFALLAATGAWAGSAVLRTGLVWVGNSQLYGCPVINASNRFATNVISRVFEEGGAITCANPCAELAPGDVCAVNNCTNGGAGAGFFYCEATSDQGGKPLRGTLVNVTTGASSEAR